MSFGNHGNFKCITKEAELTCQLLLCRPAPCTFSIATSNDIRLCALSFMTCGEHEYVPAAAAMMVSALSLPKQTVTYLIFSINTLMLMNVFVLLGI